MADTSIYNLTASGAIADGDLLPIVDVSDTTQSANGSTRKITKANLTTDLAPKVSPTLTTPILGVATATSLGITGTAGAGYIDLLGQSSAPASPSAGTGRLHTAEANGFTRLEFHSEALVHNIIGQDNVFIAKNTSGGAITKGQVVYVTGSVGDVPTVSLAKADSLTTLTATIGIATETSIANNGFGQFMWGGILTAIDTSAFTTGNALYVSASTAGLLTSTKPAYPNFQKFIGVVLNSGVGNGSILINVAPFNGGAELGTNASAFSLAGSLELGHATDTTISRVSAGVIAVEGVTVPTISSTNTLTNKRITERVTSEASSATPTINTDNSDAHSITALATAVTSMTTNLSGTPTNFQKLIIRFKDDGTARAITWGASFEAKGVALPTTTVISKVLTVGFIYDTVTAKWGCVASAQEA